MNHIDRLREIALGINELLFPDICKDLRLIADYIQQLEDQLEATRQAWVNEEDPRCDNVCVISCKGACGVRPFTPPPALTGPVNAVKDGVIAFASNHGPNDPPRPVQ